MSSSLSALQPAENQGSLDAVRRRFSDQDAATRWNELYDRDPQRLDEAHFRWRRDLAVSLIVDRLPRGGRVLDLGCGAGPLLDRLLGLGVDAVGMDFADDMLAHARARLRRSGHDPKRVMQRDCRATGLPSRSFDVVACLGVISYVEDYRPILAEIVRLLRPGGTALVSYRNHWNPVLSDPVRTARVVARGALSPVLGERNPDPFVIGRYLRDSDVADALDAHGLIRERPFGLGYGPLRLAGRKLLSESAAIRLSRLLTRAAGHQPRLAGWLSDIRLWVCRKPGEEPRA